MSANRILTDAIMSSDNLQVWNNATFDDDDDKENRQTPAAIRLSPLAANPTASSKVVHFRTGDEDASIDAEIEKIEREIKRLSKRLEELKMRKAGRDSKAALASSRGGRVVAARFMDDLLTKKKNNKKAEEGEENAASAKLRRRRGMSIGPLEITPLRSATQSRRKSCILKSAIFDLGGGEEEEEKRKEGSGWTARSVGKKSHFLKNPVIEEDKSSVANLEAKSSKVEVDCPLSARRRGASLGPLEMLSCARKSAMTEGRVRKESRVPVALQPRALFQDGDGGEGKGRSSKRGMKGRTVSSRYNSVTTQTPPERKKRKWSLPEKDDKKERGKEEGKRSVAWAEGAGVSLVTAEMVEGRSIAEMKSPAPLPPPRIRTSRCVEGDGARESGPLKRVAELAGRRTHFGGLMDSTSSQDLRFRETQERGEAVDDEDTPPFR